MRLLTLAVLLLIAPLASSQDTLAELTVDAKKKKAIDKALKLFSKYFSDKRSVKAAHKQAALNAFKEWLRNSPDVLGVNALAKPQLMVELLDAARVSSMPKIRGGGLRPEFRPGDDLRDGFQGFAYRAPKGYKPTNKAYPLVVTLHGRVTDPRHPAFRGKKGEFTQRGRAALYNYWLESPAKDEIIVVAPSGSPTGFEFSEAATRENRYMKESIALYRTLGAAMEDFRVDWNRIFLEVQGSAFRWVIEQPFVFSGYIVRDGQIPPEQYFLFENLNGVPLIYVADKKKLNAFGRELTQALKAAYKKAGASANLLILEGERDAHKALKTNANVIARFVRNTVRQEPRKKFSWRFFRETTISPIPIIRMRANFFYDETQPKEKTAGRIEMEIKPEQINVGGAQRPATRIEVKITEAESFKMVLRDDVVPLDDPVTIVVNGKVVVDKKVVARDLDLFIKYTLSRRYFMFPFMAEIEVSFPLKHEYEAKEARGGAGGAGGPGGGKPGGAAAAANGKTEKNKSTPDDKSK